MAISKLILNGEVQMDVTSDTVMADKLLSGYTATKNDGTKITGTHSGTTSYTATISGSGNSSYCYVTYNSTKYYTNGNTFTFKAGDSLTIYCRGYGLTINQQEITLSNYSYTYTLPIGDIDIYMDYTSSTDNFISIETYIHPSGQLNITGRGLYNIYSYALASVPQGSAFPPAVTITKAPTIGVNTSGIVTASYNGSSSITPTVTSGYISQGTAGTISTTGTSTYQLTSKAAATYYPSTADQTIASQRWLVGNQTIKSVVTSNLTAANIAEGVVVKVGDSSNASRITQITGTHSGGTDIVTFTELWDSEGETFISVTCNKTYNECAALLASGIDLKAIYQVINEGYEDEPSTYGMTGRFVTSGGEHCIYTAISSWGVPSFEVTYASNGTINVGQPSSVLSLSVSANGTYRSNNAVYNVVQVNVPTGFTVDDIALRNITGVISGSASFIGTYAFATCSGITEAIFPNVERISGYAFSGCSSLLAVSFPQATFINAYAFQSCINLSYLNFPAVTSLGGGVFSGCLYATSISFPELSYIVGNTFGQCRWLTSLYFPKVSYLSGSVFYSCASVSTASFPKLTAIYSSSTFYSCSKLMSLYLLGSSVVTLSQQNTFYNTPMSLSTLTGSFGSIYVPSSLYNSYKTATNWSVYSSRFVSV